LNLNPKPNLKVDLRTKKKTIRKEKNKERKKGIPVHGSNSPSGPIPLSCTPAAADSRTHLQVSLPVGPRSPGPSSTLSESQGPVVSPSFQLGQSLTETPHGAPPRTIGLLAGHLDHTPLPLFNQPRPRDLLRPWTRSTTPPPRCISEQRQREVRNIEDCYHREISQAPMVGLGRTARRVA
jgi:hypothetical protein